MKSFAFAALLLAAPAAAGPNSTRNSNDSGADAFREVVVRCLVAGMEAGSQDPVTLAAQCIEATQDIWVASYPSAWFPCAQP